MAVLWKQREIVRVLDYISKKSMRETKDILGSFAEKDNKNAKYFKHHYVTGNIGDHYIYENELLNYFLKKDKKSTLDVDYVIDHQKLLESCIKDKYISYIHNDDFGKENVDDIKQTSGRMIQVSYDKGYELLNSFYYYLGYLPKTFPEPARIVVNVIITIITTLITISIVMPN